MSSSHERLTRPLMADFTEDAYRDLLQTARARFHFLDRLVPGERGDIAIWRHDIDMSPHRALRLAQIENELALPCHYFVMFGSRFYNVFEPAVTAILREIPKLGHRVGLHFDAAAYAVATQDEMEQALRREAEMLGALLDAPIGSFSLHNPTAAGTVKFAAGAHTGLVNASAPSLVEQFTYCSDSNGIWRHRPLHDVLADPAVRRVYALTHPEWWPPEALLPRQRIQRCIDGRSRRVGIDYDQDVASFGRYNK